MHQGDQNMNTWHKARPNMRTLAWIPRLSNILRYLLRDEDTFFFFNAVITLVKEEK